MPPLQPFLRGRPLGDLVGREHPASNGLHLTHERAEFMNPKGLAVGRSFDDHVLSWSSVQLSFEASVAAALSLLSGAGAN
jgi:hypothetical protein